MWYSKVGAPESSSVQPILAYWLGASSRLAIWGIVQRSGDRYVPRPDHSENPTGCGPANPTVRWRAESPPQGGSVEPELYLVIGRKPMSGGSDDRFLKAENAERADKGCVRSPLWCP